MNLMYFDLMMCKLKTLDPKIQKHLMIFTPNWIDQYLNPKNTHYQKNIRNNRNKNTISYNKDLTWEIICNYPQIDWNYFQFLFNDEMVSEIIGEKFCFPHQLFRSDGDFRYYIKRILSKNYKDNHNGNNNGNDNFAHCIKEMFSDINLLIKESETKQKEITINMVLQNPNIYNFNYLSKNNITINPKMTPEIILQHPHLPWSYKMMHLNPSITLDLIERTMDKPWSFCVLSQNKIITYEFIKKHPNLKWSIINLIKNPNFTFDMIINDSYFDVKSLRNIYIKATIMSRKATLKNFLENPYIMWDYIELSQNPNITIETCLTNTHLPWVYKYLSYKKDLTIEHIKKHLNQTWDFKFLTKHLDITFQTVIDNPEFPWNYHCLPDNKHCKLTWQNVIDHPEIDWDYSRIIFQQNLFYKYMEKKIPRAIITIQQKFLEHYYLSEKMVSTLAKRFNENKKILMTNNSTLD